MVFKKGHTYYLHPNSIKTRFKKGQKSLTKGKGRKCKHKELYWYCLPCQNEYQRNRNQKIKKENPEKYLKQWRESGKRDRKRNPIKVSARNKVKYALKKGYLKKLACEICKDKNTHAHHEDYSRPLDVKWLCKIHHLKEHGKLKYLNKSWVI